MRAQHSHLRPQWRLGSLCDPGPYILCVPKASGICVDVRGLHYHSRRLWGCLGLYCSWSRLNVQRSNWAGSTMHQSPHVGTNRDMALVELALIVWVLESWLCPLPGQHRISASGRNRHYGMGTGELALLLVGATLENWPQWHGHGRAGIT